MNDEDLQKILDKIDETEDKLLLSFDLHTAMLLKIFDDFAKSFDKGVDKQ